LREIRAAELALRYGTDDDAHAHLREAENHIDELLAEPEGPEATARNEGSTVRAQP
jgi:hypothetical protein